MSPIPEDRMNHYPALAQKSALENRDGDVAQFFERVEREGAPVFGESYCGPESFFMAPNLRDLDAIDIAITGVPMDASAPMRAGARHGPKAIREWSKLRGPVHESWNVVPFDLCRVADFGDMALSSPHDVSTCVDEIAEQYRAFRAHNIAPLSIGGVHTISHPILRGLAEGEGIGMIHIDAHADTYRGPYQGDQLSDAAVFLNATLDGSIDPERVVQIGIRGRSAIFWDFSHEAGMRVIAMDEFFDVGVEGVLAEVRRIIGDGPCYLTVDADGIDSTYLPGTQLPEPFGLTSREVLQIIRGLRGMDIVGADFMELCPPYDPHGISANLGAALCFEMLCLLAEAHVARTGASSPTKWS